MPPSKYSSRRLEIYFASMEERQEFEAWAKAHKAPTSKFLVSQLRAAKERTSAKPQPGKAAKELQMLRDRIAELEGDLYCKNARLAAVEAANERAQELAFSDGSQEVVAWNARLIQTLVENGPIQTDTLLALMGIEGDTTRRKTVSNELETLEGAGVVKRGSRGWAMR